MHGAAHRHPLVHRPLCTAQRPSRVPRAPQVLRATVPNGDDVLLKMDLAAGHFSASDRYRYLRELAFDYAWLLDQMGKASVAPAAEAEADGCSKGAPA